MAILQNPGLLADEVHVFGIQSWGDPFIPFVFLHLLLRGNPHTVSIGLWVSHDLDQSSYVASTSEALRRFEIPSVFQDASRPPNLSLYGIDPVHLSHGRNATPCSSLPDHPHLGLGCCNLQDQYAHKNPTISPSHQNFHQKQGPKIPKRAAKRAPPTNPPVPNHFTTPIVLPTAVPVSKTHQLKVELCPTTREQPNSFSSPGSL